MGPPAPGFSGVGLGFDSLDGPGASVAGGDSVKDPGSQADSDRLHRGCISRAALPRLGLARRGSHPGGFGTADTGFESLYNKGLLLTPAAVVVPLVGCQLEAQLGGRVRRSAPFRGRRSRNPSRYVLGPVSAPLDPLLIFWCPGPES